MPDNGKSKRVKNAVMALLGTLQYDAGSGPEAAFVKVTDTSYLTGAGSPTAQVLPGDMTNNRQTVSQSERVLAYTIRVVVQTEDISRNQSSVIDQLYDLTDLVIDLLDETDQHSTLSDTSGSLGTYMLQATRGDWLELPTNSGYALSCDVNVEITYSKNL